MRGGKKKNRTLHAAKVDTITVFSREHPVCTPTSSRSSKALFYSWPIFRRALLFERPRRRPSISITFPTSRCLSSQKKSTILPSFYPSVLLYDVRTYFVSENGAGLRRVRVRGRNLTIARAPKSPLISCQFSISGFQ